MINGYLKKIFDELLFYSGQFALFYIIMQLIMTKSRFLMEVGHIILLLALILEMILLGIYGDKIPKRIIFSFLVPLLYSFFEIREGINDLLNIAHMGFWIYALISSILMILKLINKNRSAKIVEVLFVILNIFIFLFIYFYFDTWKEEGSTDRLVITNISEYLKPFLVDPTHWFIIIGGSLLAFTIALGRWEIERLKERITSLFGKYVDKSVRDTIIHKGEYQAKKGSLAILFSDIRDFTMLCENQDAQSISQMLNIYFDYWNDIVKKHNGIIDKYIGDAIMIIFGLDNSKNPCDSAVNCALEVIRNKSEFLNRLKSGNLPIPSGFGIGCHFGELIIGDIGSSDRKNFTVIGDTVNIASRLESLSRQVESEIIISDKLYNNLKTDIRKIFLPLGDFELKGKSSSIKAWGNFPNAYK